MLRPAFAALLAISIASLVATMDAPRADAQEKKKDKRKDKEKMAEAAGEVKEDLSRVLPVFDPGAHIRPISAMGFTRDKSKLVTVGQDFTIQVWSTATGERRDILRLPGYGREKGYDPGRWDVAAVSADGTKVAIGGQAKFLYDHEAKANAQARLLLVDVEKRKVARVQLQGNTAEVSGLGFSPDGETLAVGLARGDGVKPSLFLIGDLSKRFVDAAPLLRTQDCTFTPTEAGGPSHFAFTRDGKTLLSASEQGPVQIWSIPAGATPKPQKIREVKVEGITTSLAWSPDGKQFTRCNTGGAASGHRRLEFWGADGTAGKVWKTEDLKPIFEGYGHLSSARFLDAGKLYITGNGFYEKLAGGGPLAGTLDLATGKVERVFGASEGMEFHSVGVHSADGSLVALSVNGRTEVVLGKPDAPLHIRCGNRTAVPYHAGWSKNAASPGFAWSDVWVSATLPRKPVVQFGFDLATVKPLGEIKNDNYVRDLAKVGEWELEVPLRPAKDKNDDEFGGRARLKKGGTVVQGFPFGKANGRTLVPNGDDPPLIAHGHHINRQGERLFLVKSDGTRVVRFLPDPTDLNDVAASPDGRFLVATTGTPRLNIFRTDGSPYPLCSFAQVSGEWVLWTSEGYYAASPGGEKLFGWAVNNGPNELVTFHPAVKFAEKFRRPEVLKLAIEKGSVKEALAALETVAPQVENILPPSAKIALVEQIGAQVKVKASADSGSKDKPIVSMRAILDGRPLPDGKGVWTPQADKPAEAEFVIDVPPGVHEVRVFARTADGSAASDPIQAVGPKSPGKQPTIHRICVGVSEYDDPSLNLNSAANDARDMFEALGRDCVGSRNRHGAAAGELLLNKDATRDRVLKAIEDVRKQTRPGDLVVCFFAGHGVVQGNAYYLLTREADPKASFKDRSLSGDDLRKQLSTIECPVLLIMDACHSAAGLVSFRTSTDDLTRMLTDDAVGVTVLSAAMAHETAGESNKHGHFTAGLLKGLRAGEGVPFDPYDRALYAHHLYSVAFSEVRSLTKGKQNPSMNLPVTAPPPVIREVPPK